MDALLFHTDENNLAQFLALHRTSFVPVVPGWPQQAVPISLSEHAGLPAEVWDSREALGKYIQHYIKQHKATYAYGGYNELRPIYGTSTHFGGLEPRRLHLGIDIWGEAGTPVMAPLGGMVHSLGFNAADGDYGATVVVSHSLDGVGFFTLYGHLARTDLDSLRKGMYLTAGEVFAQFGTEPDNGDWPPHLHFQIIADMGLYEGDYPGVCAWSQRDFWLRRSPDPKLILGEGEMKSKTQSA